jgi:hypothetical protein
MEVPPLLRYGKYCGILYSGCPGEKPCDALDACCMVHDHCVDTHNSTASIPLSLSFRKRTTNKARETREETMRKRRR